jgi:hypothetical protein
MGHRLNYHKDYHQKVINDAIHAYGDKCGCVHCILPKGYRPLRMILVDRSINIGQGQYGIALYAKRMKYKKRLLILLCRDCYPSCQHSYLHYTEMTLKHIEKLNS